MDVLEKNLGELASSIRHHSIHGETPGYDISYIDELGTKQAIEVKGSELSKVSSFDLTDNELDAARKLGDNYTVWVVVNVGNNPRYGRIKDPYSLWQYNNLEISLVKRPNGLEGSISIEKVEIGIKYGSYPTGLI